MISDQNATGLYGPVSEWFGLGFIWSESGIAGAAGAAPPTIDIELDSYINRRSSLDSTVNRTPAFQSTIQRGPNLTSDLS